MKIKHYVIQRKDTGTYLRSYWIESTWTKNLQLAKIFNTEKSCRDCLRWKEAEGRECRMIGVELTVKKI